MDYSRRDKQTRLFERSISWPRIKAGKMNPRSNVHPALRISKRQKSRARRRSSNPEFSPFSFSTKVGTRNSTRKKKSRIDLLDTYQTRPFPKHRRKESACLSSFDKLWSFL